MNLITSDYTPIEITNQEGKLVVSSRNIAAVFGREHYNVIRDIKAVLEANDDAEFTALNFEVSEYTDPTGRKLPEYLLTRDGTMLLIMGYTGAKAMQLKTAYIKRFNEMEALLSNTMGSQVLDRNKLDIYSYVFEKAGISGNQLALALDKVVVAKTGESALALGGVQLIRPQPKQLSTPTEIGKPLGLSAIKVNKMLEARGLQTKVSGQWVPTEAGLQAGATVLDTGKKHSSGVPVTQLKWPADILA